MIDLKLCRFGDKLKTKGGQIVVYLGYSKPITVELLECEGSHIIAGINDSPVGVFWLGQYYDNGVIVERDGKMCGAGRDENIISIFRDCKIDLSKNQFGDRLLTRRGSMAIFLGYNNKTEYYEIEVIGELTKKHETISCNKNGEVNNSSMFQFDIIGKWEE